MVGDLTASIRLLKRNIPKIENMFDFTGLSQRKNRGVRNHPKLILLFPGSALSKLLLLCQHFSVASLAEILDLK
jgi:hypothetical protein